MVAMVVMVSMVSMVSMVAMAQTLTPLQQLASWVRNVNTFNYMYPQEKVYLHFDNTGYFIGENMWFKAYVVAGPQHKPTSMSGVLYVELLTPEGRIVQSDKLKIENGQAWGRFQLGHLIHAGYYEVRAYTRMMLNWDERGVFSRVFPVFDKAKTTSDYLNPKMTLPQRSQKIPEERQKPSKDDTRNTKTKGDITVSFYPEGGNLIAGVKQTVAVKICDKDGRGIDASGKITDENDNVLTEFQTKKNGIGTFEVVAQEEKPYKVRVERGETKDSKVFELPKAEAAGYVMHVNAMREDAVGINVTSYDNDNDDLAIVAMNGGDVYIFQPAEMEGGQFAMAIEREALREGVTKLILYNKDGEIMAQRMVFKRPAESQLNFTASFNKKQYEPFDSVFVDFSLTDAEQKPVESTFSLAVRDVDTNLPGSHTGNALNNLLLSSDLKGFIEDIDWYFEADDEEHNRALDNLMLTQGWYRYDFRQMQKPQDFKIEHYIEEGLVISGQLTSYMRHRDKAGAKIGITLYNKEKGMSKKGSAIADSTGHFAFLSEDFTGRWQMYIRTQENDKTKEMTVHLDRQFSPDSRAYEPLDTWMYLVSSGNSGEPADSVDSGAPTPTSNRKKYDKYKYENLIPETVITAEKRWMEGKALKNANIVYDLEEERTREDDTGELYLESLFDYLERTNKYFTFEIDSNGNHECFYKNRKVQWIIDNQDHSLVDVEQINAKQIEAILINDRYGSAWKYASSGLDSINGTSGVDNSDLISTAGNDDPATQASQATETEDYVKAADSINKVVLIYLYIDKNAVVDRRGERNTVVQGYTKYVDFYSPDYSVLVLPDERDFRRTLYWNPNIKTNAKGKARVKFYNSETCSDMQLDAETIAPSGQVGHCEALQSSAGRREKGEGSREQGASSR